MSTPNKKSEPAKKISPTSVADLVQQEDFEDPYSLMDGLMEDNDIRITENDPAILIVSHRLLLLAMINIANAPNPPTFMGNPELPADGEELVNRIITYCQAQIGGAGVNLNNCLLYNLNVGTAVIVGVTIENMRVDPYIASLRQQLGGPPFMWHVISSKIQIEASRAL